MLEIIFVVSPGACMALSMQSAMDVAPSTCHFTLLQRAFMYIYYALVCPFGRKVASDCRGHVTAIC